MNLYLFSPSTGSWFCRHSLLISLEFCCPACSGNELWDSCHIFPDFPIFPMVVPSHSPHTEPFDVFLKANVFSYILLKATLQCSFMNICTSFYSTEKNSASVFPDTPLAISQYLRVSDSVTLRPLFWTREIVQIVEHI